MKRNKVLVLLAATILLTTASIFAQQGHGKMQGPQEGNRIMRGIPDLTEYQLDNIKDLHMAHLKEIKPLKNDVKINKVILETLQTEDKPDLDKINDLIEKNGTLLTDIRKNQVAHKLEIRNLLTDDQKIFFDNKIQRMRRASHDKFHGKGMGAHRGMGHNRRSR